MFCCVLSSSSQEREALKVIQLKEIHKVQECKQRSVSSLAGRWIPAAVQVFGSIQPWRRRWLKTLLLWCLFCFLQWADDEGQPVRNGHQLQNLLHTGNTHEEDWGLCLIVWAKATKIQRPDGDAGVDTSATSHSINQELHTDMSSSPGWCWNIEQCGFLASWRVLICDDSTFN